MMLSLSMVPLRRRYKDHGWGWCSPSRKAGADDRGCPSVATILLRLSPQPERERMTGEGVETVCGQASRAKGWIAECLVEIHPEKRPRPQPGRLAILAGWQSGGIRREAIVGGARLAGTHPGDVDAVRDLVGAHGIVEDQGPSALLGPSTEGEMMAGREHELRPVCILRDRRSLSCA